MTIRVLIARQHGRIGDQRTKRLHQVECQSGPAESRLMIEAEERIETDRVADDRQVLRQHAVGQRQQGVDWIARRTAVAMVEVESEFGDAR